MLGGRFVALSACMHELCAECAVGWLKSNISDGKVDTRKKRGGGVVVETSALF